MPWIHGHISPAQHRCRRRQPFLLHVAFTSELPITGQHHLDLGRAKGNGWEGQTIKFCSSCQQLRVHVPQMSCSRAYSSLHGRKPAHWLQSAVRAITTSVLSLFVLGSAVSIDWPFAASRLSPIQQQTQHCCFPVSRHTC